MCISIIHMINYELEFTNEILTSYFLIESTDEKAFPLAELLTKRMKVDIIYSIHN